MRKIITIVGIVIAGVVGVALIFGGGSKAPADAAAPEPTPAAASEAPAPVNIPSSEAPASEPEFSNERLTMIAAGDDWNTKMATQVETTGRSNKALDALMHASYSDSDYQAVLDENDEATAAMVLAGTQLGVATTAWDNASADCGFECMDLTSAHLQILSAQASLMVATPTTMDAAAQAMNDALHAWTTAKAGA